MHKIFKYTFNAETGEATIPRNAFVLRIDHVDDGFYKGDFLWAIVDLEKKDDLKTYTFDEARRKQLNLPPAETFIKGNFHKVELRVKEKQKVIVPGHPVGAGEIDGKMFIYCEPGTTGGEIEIAVFKTGQEIDVPLHRLTYLGLNRLWIIQELGLYTFIVEK